MQPYRLFLSILLIWLAMMPVYPVSLYYSGFVNECRHERRSLAGPPLSHMQILTYQDSIG